LDAQSEQSVRLGEEGKKTRPKTAYKEKHKIDEPGVGEIAMHKKRLGPVTHEKEVEMARRKLFQKLKEDRQKKNEIIAAIKSSVSTQKFPQLTNTKEIKKQLNKSKTRPATGKPKGKEIVIDQNNENDYEQFLNGNFILELSVYLSYRPKRDEIQTE
jgi:hypothetical protein